MSVTEIRPEPAPLDQLLERIDTVIASTVPALTLAAARQMCNDTGVVRYQRELEAAIDQYETAQEAKRSADHRLSVAREELDTQMAEAEWMLNDRLVVRANKTWLAVNDNGKPIDEADQRSLTADEKKEWLRRTAATHPAVKQAAADVTSAEQRLRECADDIGLRDRALQALRHHLDAAVAELETYRVALTATQPTTTTNGARS